MFSVDGTKLDYSADMAAMDQPMQVWVVDG
jgi:hypothetical protein